MNQQSFYQLKWAWALTNGHRPQLSLYFLLELLTIVLSLLFVFYSKRAVDIAMGVEGGSLKLTIILVVLCLSAVLIMGLFSGWLNERTKLRMMVLFQNMLIKKQMHARWRFVKQFHTGDLMVRINADSTEVIQMLCNTGLSFLITNVRLIASLGFLWFIDPVLAYLIIAICPLFLFSKIYFKKMRILSRGVKKLESLTGNLMQENLRLRLLIQALGVMSIRQQKFEQNQQSLYQLRLDQLNFLTLTQGIMKLAVNAGYLLTFIWGIYRLYNHQISYGTMMAFLQLIGRIQTPVLSLIASVPSFIRFRTSAERLIELDSIEQDESSRQEYMLDIRGIEFKKVSFQYEDKTVINDLNAKVNIGEPTAIIGASGKGKTTFIRLLLALIKPDVGEIVIEDRSSCFNISSHHRINFAYVPQGNTLFAGTVAENLAIDDRPLSEERLNYALHLACAEFVYDLPEGLNTEIGESGYGLSEGQAQRISIARAMMRESGVWLFDEITSALDEKISALLMERILIAGKNKIIIFVTHDLELAKKCHQNIYMH